MKPFKYQSWIIWPAVDETTGKIVGYDIHEPDNYRYSYASLPTVEEAQTAIRRYRRQDNPIRSTVN